MIEYHAEMSDDPGFDELATSLLAATWKAQPLPATREQFGARRSMRLFWIIL